MVNMFTNIHEALSSSTNFLHGKDDLPHHDPLVYVQYTTSYYKVSMMQSIKLTRKSKKRFCYFYLVPDSKSLAEECKAAFYDCKAKERVGKAKENLSKVKTMITTSMTISNVHHLRAYLVSIFAIIKAQFVCDLSLQDIHTPATPRQCLSRLAPLPSIYLRLRCGPTSRRATAHTSLWSSGASR